MLKTIRISGRFDRQGLLKASFDRIRIKEGGYDKANELIIELAFIAEKEKKPFKTYLLYDSEHSALIEVLHNYLELKENLDTSNSPYLLDDECMYLFWVTQPIDDNETVGIYIFDKDGERVFDLTIKEKDLRTFYEAFQDVIDGGYE